MASENTYSAFSGTEETDYSHDIQETQADDEDVETMTAAEVMQKLEEAWLNEKFSPELLEHQTDIVDCMLEQLQQMEANIKRRKAGDLTLTIHKMEIERIRYVLSSYLRLRLGKIEMFCDHILLEEKNRPADQASKLSVQEHEFAKTYIGSIQNHLKSVALRHMPAKLETLDPAKTADHPNMECYVFVKANEDAGRVLIEEETADNREEVIDMDKGTQYILRYKPVSHLIKSGELQLI